MIKPQRLALRWGAAGQIAPEHGLEADRELLLGQQRPLGHAEHEFRGHLVRSTDQLRSAATEQAILRKVSENRAPIGPLHHPNEGWSGATPPSAPPRRFHPRMHATAKTPMTVD